MNIMNRTKKDIAAAVADQTGMTKKEGINPATVEKIEIAASRAPKFKAAKTLKDELK